MKKEPEGVFQSTDKEPVIDRIFKLAERYPSRNAAARAWGIKEDTVKNYYRRQDAQPMPRQHHLMQIAKAEGVSLEWLLTGEGETPNTPEKTPKTPNGDDLAYMLSFLTVNEREGLTEVLARKGVETVLYLLDEKNIKLLQTSDHDKTRMFMLLEEKTKKETSELSRSVAEPSPEADSKKVG